MKFWDTSALVPLLVHEAATKAMRAHFAADPIVLVAWTTPVECASAIARAEHDGLLTRGETGAAFSRLDELAILWREVEPTNDVRDTAKRLLRVHRLRAADAVQLASAILAADRRPASLNMVTLDDRLAKAAGKEGFVIVGSDV
ncbi:MAG: type II toxin-antitoxin system VapC family toxin [Vicinamibacteria bacterium]